MRKQVNLMDLLEQYVDDDTPKDLEQLPSFEERCRHRGYKEAADYLEHLYIFIKYQIEREWNVDSTTKNTTERPYRNEDRILWQDGEWQVSLGEDTN